MAGIPRILTQFASYNGFAFNESAHTTRLTIEPVESADGRTVAYNRWTITIKFELAVGALGTTDALVLAAVTRLSHPGGVFIYRGRGLGNPDINTGIVNDLRYGPKPKVLAVELVGPGNAVTITWSVEFAAPNCPGVLNPWRFLELGYKVSHGIDKAGFTTRYVSGYLVVPNNRTAPGSRRVQLSADEYRADILTEIPNGFQRDNQRFDESYDLSRLDFSWTDTEQPVPLPPGIVEASFKDDVSSTGAGLARWSGTISANYRMARGYDWTTAAKAFFEMLSAVITDRNKRLGAKPAANANNPAINIPGVPQNQGKLENKEIPTVVVPTGFSMSNPNRYGPPNASFGFSYTFSCPLSKLLAATGMYLPFKHDYRLWFASMKDSAHNPYGGAGLVWTPFDEPGITDVCEVPGVLKGGAWEPPAIPVPPAAVPNIPGLQPPGSAPGGESRLNAYVGELVKGTFPKPQFEDSWVDYRNEIFVEADTGILHVKKLPSRVPDAQDGVFAERGIVPPAVDAMAAANFNLFGNNVSLNVGGKLEPTYTTVPGIQRRTAETCVVYLKGHAYRVGYPVNPPRLISIGGVPCIPLCRPDRGEGFGQGVLANSVQTLNYAYWNLRYVLPAVPTGPLPVPPNPQDKP